jgi:hypothetical protein
MIGRLMRVLPFVGVGLACATLSDPLGRERALSEAQLHYTQHVRWGNLDAASEFVDPELRDEFLEQRPAFDAVRITEYDIGRIDYGDDRESATVRVTYHAYSLASLEERRIEERQRWVRPGGNTWFVQPELAGLLPSAPGRR